MSNFSKSELRWISKYRVKDWPAIPWVCWAMSRPNVGRMDFILLIASLGYTLPLKGYKCLMKIFLMLDVLNNWFSFTYTSMPIINNSNKHIKQILFIVPLLLLSTTKKQVVCAQDCNILNPYDVCWINSLTFRCYWLPLWCKDKIRDGKREEKDQQMNSCKGKSEISYKNLLMWQFASCLINS